MEACHTSREKVVQNNQGHYESLIDNISVSVMEFHGRQCLARQSDKSDTAFRLAHQSDRHDTAMPISLTGKILPSMLPISLTGKILPSVIYCQSV